MFLQVQITIDNRKSAYFVANTLIESKLGACVQVLGPIHSTYLWKGSVEHEEEFLCFIKTTDDHYEDLEKMILDIHPYDVPEIIATPIIRGNPKYLDWLLQSTEGKR